MVFHPLVSTSPYYALGSNMCIPRCFLCFREARGHFFGQPIPSFFAYFFLHEDLRCVLAQADEAF